MTENRQEKRRAKKIMRALDTQYTRALRIYRTAAVNHRIDWDTVSNEKLQELFGDVN